MVAAMAVGAERRAQDVAGPVGSARLRLAALLLLVVPLGFAAKLHGTAWMQNYGAGVLYEVFWVLAVLMLRPGLSPRGAAAGVLAVTAVLEFLQLWHPSPLEAARSTFAGQALLGSDFSWWDFPHYLAGCVVGAWAGRAAVRGREKRSAARG